MKHRKVDLVKIFKERLLPLLRVKDSPTQVAWGVSIGLFVGFTPTVGVQIAIVLATAALPSVRFNIPIACTMVWVSNPLTTIPLYYAIYYLGVVLLDNEIMGFISFKKLLQELVVTIKEGESFIDSLWLGITGIFDIGMDIALPMWIGGVVLGIIFAVPAGLYTRWWLLRRQEKKARALKKT